MGQNEQMTAVIVGADLPVAIVGGGPVRDDDLLAISGHVSEWIAADGGADHLLDAQITPAAVIGDLDSISDTARNRFAKMLHHVAEQETTDFEKALIRVRSPCVLAVGFTGGRVDHSLAVLNVMTRHIDRAVVLVGVDDVSFLARLGQTLLELPIGTRISLMPLADAWIDTEGLRWPVVDAAMHPAGFTSPSNETADTIVNIRAKGPVLITLPRYHLQAAVQAVVPAK